MEYLQTCGWMELAAISLVLNFGLYFLSIGIYTVISYFSNKNTIQADYQQLKRSDIFLSIFVVVCNALVMVLSVNLLRQGWLVLAPNNPLFVVFEVGLLLWAMDIGMYVFHRIAHHKMLFRLIHGSHHQHTSTNAISLFVLHPLEAIGFGFILIGALMLHPFSALAITAYLLINLIWGTLGHLNVEVFPPKFKSMFIIHTLCTVTFHNRHHQSPHYNFGFYTNVWDKIFGTYKEE